MQSGDIYRPQGDDEQPRQQQGYTSPTRTGFPASTTYPTVGYGSNLYDNPPPAPGQLPHSQSQPFATFPPTGGYGDPFNDDPPTQPIQQQGYADPPGSRHYSPQPSMSNTVPFPGSPPRQGTSPPQGPRTRFQSNVSYHSTHGLTNTPSYSYDNRLASPPPLLPHHSSSSSVGQVYPPMPTTTPQGALYGGRAHDDDVNDSAPLLAHATPDARFGIPPSGSMQSLRPPNRYQLSDVGSPGRASGEGDMGIAPGSWDASRFPNGGPGEEDDNNVHYGPVPNRIVRRNRTQKRVA